MKPVRGIETKAFQLYRSRPQLSNKWNPFAGLKQVVRFPRSEDNRFQINETRSRDWNRSVRHLGGTHASFQINETRSRDWNFDSSSLRAKSSPKLSNKWNPFAGLKLLSGEISCFALNCFQINETRSRDWNLLAPFLYLALSINFQINETRSRDWNVTRHF